MQYAANFFGGGEFVASAFSLATYVDCWSIPVMHFMHVYAGSLRWSRMSVRPASAHSETTSCLDDSLFYDALALWSSVH